MTTLLRFEQAAVEQVGLLSFGLAAGELRVLLLASAEAKQQVIELALGEQAPGQGSVLLQGQAATTMRPGSIGWVPANGGLISNLKAWENVTLPLWYHGKRHVGETEAAVAGWLERLGMPQSDWSQFMASPAGHLRPPERKLAGLLRGLLLEPSVLLVDASLLDEVDGERRIAWLDALEQFVKAAEPRAVLAVAHAETAIPWTRIEPNI